jgi:hypothetical protein
MKTWQSATLSALGPLVLRVMEALMIPLRFKVRSTLLLLVKRYSSWTMDTTRSPKHFIFPPVHGSLAKHTQSSWQVAVRGEARLTQFLSFKLAKLAKAAASSFLTF